MYPKADQFGGVRQLSGGDQQDSSDHPGQVSEVEDVVRLGRGWQEGGHSCGVDCSSGFHQSLGAGVGREGLVIGRGP